MAAKSVAAIVLAALTAIVMLVCVSGSGAASTPATPITETGPKPTTPKYIGKPAKPDPVVTNPVWQSPYMAPNPRNSVHNDAWQTDAYTQFAGPLGKSPETLSTEIGRTCITLTFDSKGRLIGTCTNLTDGPGLYLLNPDTLATIAFKQLPFIPPPDGTNPALNTTGGAYFYLDNHDRVVVAAANRHILRFEVDDSGSEPVFRKAGDWDLASCLPDGERLPSALPDKKGRIWFVGRYQGTVGVLDRKTGECDSIVLGEEIENSFAIAKNRAYIVSDRALYKFGTRNGLKPHAFWQTKYENTGEQKTGQINAGSGTTPTLIGGGSSDPQYVAITDNADPMNVVVYQTADHTHADARRVCREPVFGKGESATENSLISMGRSLVVENNYGYDLQQFNDVIAGGVPIGGDPAKVSSPGIARIDINKDGKDCRKIWTNKKVRAASVVPKGDAKNGLIYTFENVEDTEEPKSDPWYWTALDYDTGKVVFKQMAGHGGLYNNHYAGIAMGRDAKTKRTTLYLGGVGGIMALRDGQ